MLIRPTSGRKADISNRKINGAQTPLTLAFCSPAFNPVENVRQYLRANWLAVSVFDDCPATVYACGLTWNQLEDDPKTATSITNRKWSKISVSDRWHYVQN